MESFDLIFYGVIPKLFVSVLSIKAIQHKVAVDHKISDSFQR